jgi:hypothetical protein
MKIAIVDVIHTAVLFHIIVLIVLWFLVTVEKGSASETFVYES